MSDMLSALILGIVEGLTEFIPVSSTGHMIIVDHFIKLSSNKEFTDSFLIIIQLGAILSVLVYYFPRLWPFSNDKEKNKDIWNMWIKIAVAVLPAVVLGQLFDDILEEKFFNPFTVSLMLIIYGVILIIIESSKKVKVKTKTIQELSFKTAVGIGFFQCLAMIPGTSRSGATIVGALLIGVSREVAAEFTFFLAIPAMFGASLLKLIKFGFHFTGAEFGLLMLGCIVSFGLSVIAIKFLMGYIKKHDFKVFGVYRIILGIAVIALSFVLF